MYRKNRERIDHALISTFGKSRLSFQLVHSGIETKPEQRCCIRLKKKANESRRATRVRARARMMYVFTVNSVDSVNGSTTKNKYVEILP